MSRYFCLEDFFKEGEVCITDQGVKDLYTLSEIVMNSHYSYASQDDKEELKSVGVAKALDLLHNGNFDPSRSSLKNYLYTGMRNEMKNYLYKAHRDVGIDDTILEAVTEDSEAGTDMYYEEMIEIPMHIVVSETRRHWNSVITLEKILSTLSYMGFDTGYRGPSGFYKEVEKEVCLVIWKKLKP